MTTAEKIADVKSRLNNDPTATDALISVYLKDAQNAILKRRYVGKPPAWAVDVPSEYENLQCRLAERYFLKRGAQGEQIHNEDGVHRHYGSVNDEDLLAEITSVVKVV